MSATRESTDAERAPTNDDGFESSDDEQYVVKPIDVSTMSISERRAQRFKDCFWDLEAKLARWFGLEDSRYEFELSVREEEDERAAAEAAREEAKKDAAARAAEDGTMA